MTVKCKSSIFFAEANRALELLFYWPEKGEGKRSRAVRSPAELLIIDAPAFAHAFVLTFPTARAFVPAVKSTREHLKELSFQRLMKILKRNRRHASRRSGEEILRILSFEARIRFSLSILPSTFVYAGLHSKTSPECTLILSLFNIW